MAAHLLSAKSAALITSLLRGNVITAGNEVQIAARRPEGTFLKLARIETGYGHGGGGYGSRSAPGESEEHVLEIVE